MLCGEGMTGRLGVIQRLKSSRIDGQSESSILPLFMRFCSVEVSRVARKMLRET